jgi:predicted O-linked N-acetylglucosamine transferase (SPINDLY family)
MSDAAWQTAWQAWQDGDVAAARNALETLLTHAPAHAAARHLYGVLLTHSGEPTTAAEQLRLACTADPANDQAWSNLGNALLEAGETIAAETALREGLKINPANPLLHFNLGCTLSVGGAARAAEAAFLQACTLDPDDQEGWLRLGSLRYARADHAAAAQAFLRAAKLEGDAAMTALRLAGFALADAGRPDEAAAVLAEYLTKSVDGHDDLPAVSQRLFCHLELCEWASVVELTARCRQLLARQCVPAEPFTFLLLDEISPAEQLALTQRFVESLTSSNSAPITAMARNASHRLRVAYLGDIFHDHATAHLATGVLEQHDRNDFEIHAFSYGPDDGGEKRRRITAACDAFHDVSETESHLLAERIRAANIDILIDLNGWTGNTRTRVLVDRPARIQVNWLGYPATLGCMGNRRLADYLVGDAIVTPLSHQPHYAETLALMPHCYQPNDNRRIVAPPPTRTQAGLPETGLVFCCFNRSLKISAPIFDVWCQILRQVPDSVLWLQRGYSIAMTNLSRAAQAAGIDPQRLIFAPHLPQSEHLARLSLADLVLDTFPYNAHTTASDALWVGVPVLTLMGETFPSRVAASLLNAVHLPGLVTHNLEDYRARAIELAQHPTVLTGLRQQLATNRPDCPLFDTEGYTRNFEALLRAMWQQHTTCETTSSLKLIGTKKSE